MRRRNRTRWRIGHFVGSSAKNRAPTPKEFDDEVSGECRLDHRRTGPPARELLVHVWALAAFVAVIRRIRHRQHLAILSASSCGERNVMAWAKAKPMTWEV